MIRDAVSVSALLPNAPATSECWLRTARADYRLCREFARHYDARLSRSLRSQRVGWEVYGHIHCALLLPDSARVECLTDDEWYLYYVSGESLFRRTRAQREQAGMILMAESADDWADLLRQALQDQVFDVRYEVAPDYINALGEIENTRSGFLFTLEACAPQATCAAAPCRVAGAGGTPEEAARDACRSWLHGQGLDVDQPAGDAGGGHP